MLSAAPLFQTLLVTVRLNLRNVCYSSVLVLSDWLWNDRELEDVEPCRCGVNRRFGGTYRLHLQGRRKNKKIRKSRDRENRWKQSYMYDTVFHCLGHVKRCSCGNFWILAEPRRREFWHLRAVITFSSGTASQTLLRKSVRNARPRARNVCLRMRIMLGPFLFSRMRAKCLANFVTLTIFGDECEIFMEFSPAYSYVGPVRSPSFAHDSVLKRPQSALSFVGNTKFRTHTKLRLSCSRCLQDDVLWM
jgi:hypothetical protein